MGLIWGVKNPSRTPQLSESDSSDPTREDSGTKLASNSLVEFTENSNIFDTPVLDQRAWIMIPSALERDFCADECKNSTITFSSTQSRCSFFKSIYGVCFSYIRGSPFI